MKTSYFVRRAQEQDIVHAAIIAFYIEQAGEDIATGICKREISFIITKIQSGDAIMAFTSDGAWAGFCYLQQWNDGYVSSCGLVVHPLHRRNNIARYIKQEVMELAKEKYPGADYFSLTTAKAVMKLNTDLGYETVTYSEVSRDEAFWSACKTCVNHNILLRNNQQKCLCTAMRFQSFNKLIN